ncbi:MAG: DUF3122 domain-containing protein [Roseofilum sp. SBFL]|uniref:DUF3122 domain-containing protein n=1 Tax=unclassified Roseofilum TaxID=2620099 RepID=UPI001B19A2C2|nr:MULTISPECIES: DUF3122 domain-containing protein [unclassified Roseofilum]MBP0012753.1 DUF3122 domain-containing protein [Roseofilum sp. SID3]MBP0026273.1 DUF3122 domain-containing protein [Roseofilum sp. SID2]MBP0037091.1 DUF3122 domain-containing protein [Roseofilum sp. SID1]MBP0043505.1 DUF3122 domain-containing protein [Roseofilum sp. SBFL]
MNVLTHPSLLKVPFSRGDLRESCPTHPGKHRVIAFLVALLLFLLPSTLLVSPPASALIRQQLEAPGQTLYQSRHSLRDRSGKTWQVILFKRIKVGELANVQLRLVGFPEQTVFQHPAPLNLKDSQNQQLSASDVFADKAPAPNVGQYELTDILDLVSASGSLELSLPVENGETRISVPAVIILEWQYLAHEY